MALTRGANERSRGQGLPTFDGRPTVQGLPLSEPVAAPSEPISAEPSGFDWWDMPPTGALLPAAAPPDLRAPDPVPPSMTSTAAMPSTGPLPSRRALRTGALPAVTGGGTGPGTGTGTLVIRRPQVGPPPGSAPTISTATGSMATAAVSRRALRSGVLELELPEGGRAAPDGAPRSRRDSRRALTAPAGGRRPRSRRRRLVQGVCLAAVVALGAAIFVYTRPGSDKVLTEAAQQQVSLPESSSQGLPGLPSAASAGPSASGSPTASPSVSVSAASSPGASGAVPLASLGASVAAGKTTTKATKAAGAKTLAASGPRKNQPGGTMAVQMYGEPRSGLPWHSGFWLGGTKSTSRIDQAGSWRGRPMDFVTCYPLYSTWSDISDPSSNVGLFAGFQGKLALGLPILPSDRAGQWNDILDGSHDDVFRGIAKELKARGFGDTAVRVGLEANGDWFPWGVNASNASQYKAAFRRIVGLMRAESPQLSFWFDVNVSANPLPGTSGRADMFDVMYPGDDVVDGISMDHYDFYSVVARNPTEFAAAMRPPNGVGLADAVDFARKHHKGFAVPEWGLHSQQGVGDNPYFFRGMFDFFQKNKDILVFEDYFNEDASYIGASIWDPVQNPQSSAVYKELWG